jgi:hypothetical protein
MAIKLTKHSMARKLVAKTKLAVHIDRAIEQTGDFKWDYKYEPKKGDNAWHPSGDCTLTPRELFDKACGNTEGDPIGAGLRKTFQVGHFWHGYLQHIVVELLGYADWDAIERSGQKVWAEEDGKPKAYNWCRGSADIAPVKIPGQGEFLVDFKTMGSFDFKRTQLPDWSAAKYEAQMNIYMDFFDLDQAIIVAINKDSPHELKEFIFDRNQPLIDTIYDKWHYVSDCLENGTIPDAAEEWELPIRGSL